MPIQVNMDRIAKSVAKVESSLNSIAELLEEQLKADDSCENVDESQPMGIKRNRTDIRERAGLDRRTTVGESVCARSGRLFCGIDRKCA